MTIPDNFVVTLELVPGRESFGRNTDTLVGIAKDAFADGRVAACSLTDNPGGNPALSPDALGYEIFRHGMDVIVHFTCRDMNRAALESRALQLARMGMKNILALTGDYSGKGFGGKGAPVFDLDAVLLNKMLRGLSEKNHRVGRSGPFLYGMCGYPRLKAEKPNASPNIKNWTIKSMPGHHLSSPSWVTMSIDLKNSSGIIKIGMPMFPVMGSVYLLSPKSARAMNRGRVPGAMISDDLCNKVVSEWRKDAREGLHAAIERAARLGVVLKGLGYRGIHIGGIHRSFKTVAAILDRMERIEEHWPDFLDEMSEGRVQKVFFDGQGAPCGSNPEKKPGIKEQLADHIPYRTLRFAHALFFNKAAIMAPVYRKLASFLEKHRKTWVLKLFLEDPVKGLFLSCQRCGDCGIQHLAFLCPESGCPKHTRNGPCGGSQDGQCEVYPEKQCVWVRAYGRLDHAKRLSEFLRDTVPPRMWELNQTSSWVNFHLGRDHQKATKCE